MTLTDEEIGEIFESYKGTIVDSIRAVIAAHDARLRQQEPCVMVAISDKDECLAMKYRAGSLAEGPHSLYAAPIPTVDNCKGVWHECPRSYCQQFKQCAKKLPARPEGEKK